MEKRTPVQKVSLTGILVSTVIGAFIGAVVGYFLGSIVFGALVVGAVFLFSAAFNFGWQTKLDPKTRDSNWTGGGF